MKYLKKIIRSDDAFEILDNSNCSGSDWGSGGCAILARALNILEGYPMYVIYNTKFKSAEHFGVKTPNETFIDHDGEHKNADKWIEFFLENEIPRKGKLVVIPYDESVDITGIKFDEKASKKLSNLISGKKVIREFIKNVLNESFCNNLNERLMLLDDDVDLLYDNFFKQDIEEIKKTNKITSSMFRKGLFHTSGLNSKIAKKVHELNPCKIYINYLGNFYHPLKNEIHISVGQNALNFTINNFNGDIEKTKDFLKLNNENQYKNYLTEFTEEKVKGSIHHELVHWIDDTLHNKHIKKRADKVGKTSVDMTKRGLPIDADKMEIQSQIHNIYQLKRKYYDIWDNLTFDDLLLKSVSLSTVNNSLKGEIHKNWKRNLKSRMYREGLLGKNMI